jgi:hypothetical protein
VYQPRYFPTFLLFFQTGKWFGKESGILIWKTKWKFWKIIFPFELQRSTKATVADAMQPPYSLVQHIATSKINLVILRS